MKKKIVIVTIKSWNINNAIKFKRKYSKDCDTLLISKQDRLSYVDIKKFNPDKIFFPHWSWIIPKKIYENYDCIVFHMTDLPYGRGGSPLQNLIIRGKTKTKISALKVTRGIDSGPIYMKKDLSLTGDAEEIYKRASERIFNHMIPYIIEKNPKTQPQKGKVIVFKRRQPRESELFNDIELDTAYNYIRMLDAEDYPSAFIETKNLRFEFTKAKKRTSCITASVKISQKKL